MARIKVGQIGTGHGHAAGKFETFRKSPEYEFVGIAEPDTDLRSRAEKSKEFSGATWLSVDQLLNTSGLQAVLIETEPKHLLEHTEACVERGLHVHLDKPAGESLPQFRRILDTVARKHLCLQMGYMYRYNPAIVLMRDLIRKGILGQPFEVHCVMSKVVDPRNRLKHGEYPGGMMFELGCHVIDVVVDLLGQPEKVTPFHQHAGKQSDQLQDNMLAVFMYPNAIASIKSSALEVDGFTRRHIVVCGTEGTIHVEPLDAPKIVKLTLASERSKYKKGYQEIEVEKYTRYTADAADFAAVIRGEKTLAWSVMHDLAVQETVLRASDCPLDK